jgi:hypothetical protein
MSDSPAPGPSTEIEPIAPDQLSPSAEVTLPPGVLPSPNYLAAIELGIVFAKSGLYSGIDKDPARAAVKIMIGMDLGVSPSASMQGISAFESEGKSVFLIEGKLLAAVVKRRPDVDYKVVKRTPEKVEIEFLRREPATDGGYVWEKQKPNIVWTIEHARQAVPKFASKSTWANYPEVMLTWRALAEGIRLHFPDVIGGQPIYLDDEKWGEESGEIREALEPPKAEALTDKRADDQRARCREVYDELKEANPSRMLPAMFDRMVKGAEHSHDRLDNTIEALESLRDSEVELQGLYAQIKDRFSDAEVKAAIDKCEREANNPARIKAAQTYVTVEGTATEEGGDDE